MRENITYKITLDKLTQHLLSVECRIKKPDEEGQIVSLPAWVPGSYMIRDYAKHMIDITAESNHKQVSITKIAKNTWRCAPCVGELLIKYHVYCFDLMPRGAYVDHTRVFFDGCRVFLVVDGEEEQTRSVEIVAPTQENCKHWTCVSSMSPLKINPKGFGVYLANNHLELIDHPFSIGKQQSFEFKVADVPHYFVVASQVPSDWKRLVSDTQKICESHVDFFGEFPAMERYVFILNVLGKGYGGIEHRASCSLLCSRNDLPILGSESINDDYRSLLGLISHEYFHLWNVKRIKPEVFTNLNLSSEVYTRQLWIFEGITAYYDNHCLIHAGIININDYLKILQKDITTIMQNPGSSVQNLEDSSFDAWLKYYQPDENTPNATISYYIKGALAALALDLLIIKNTRRKQSLADIMQVLWQQYGKTGLGLPEGYFEHLCYEITGVDYADFFELALRTCEELPLAELLLEVGIIAKICDADYLENLGLRIAADNTKILVRSVLNYSVLEQAGLAPNDIIIAVNGYAVTPGNLEATLRRFATQPKVNLQVFRNDILMDLAMLWPDSTKSICQLELALNPSQTQLLNYQKWLGI